MILFDRLRSNPYNIYVYSSFQSDSNFSLYFINDIYDRHEMLACYVDLSLFLLLEKIPTHQHINQNLLISIDQDHI